MESLSLQLNDLKFLSGNLFATAHQRFVRISASHNPWHCDSNMESLHQFLQSSNDILFIGIVCKSPTNYAGKALRYEQNRSGLAPVEEPSSNLVDSSSKEESDSVEQSIDSSSNNRILLECKVAGAQNRKQMIHMQKPSNKTIPWIRFVKRKLFIEYKLSNLKFGISNCFN